MATGETRIIGGLAEIADGYDAVLCDLWGCYHNGIAPYAGAIAALQAYRAQGGAVVLLTNAPRPRHSVLRQLERMGAPADSWDAIVTSGDATRAELASGRYGRRVHVVGPERDAQIWEGLELALTSLDEAEAILCTGLFDDETETPEDYAGLVAEGVKRGLPLLCANPDIIVDRGHTRIFCAGAIAQAYAEGGGETVYFGKPHPPIYALAMEVARDLRPELKPERLLAIGDGIATDVLGAEQAGLDCLFIGGGLAAAEIGEAADRPDPDLLARYLHKHQRAPRYAMGLLA